MKKKVVKWGLAIVIGGVIVGGAAIFYMFNMPHRDVQNTPIDFQVEAGHLVQEYLVNAHSANDRYLQEEGESKIIAVTGVVASIDEDLKQQKVVLLRAAGEPAGVSCTFMANTNINAEKLKEGDKVTIKGVIRSGAGYDDDLELYEDVIIEKCDVLHI